MRAVGYFLREDGNDADVAEVPLGQVPSKPSIVQLLPLPLPPPGVGVGTGVGVGVGVGDGVGTTPGHDCEASALMYSS